MKPNAKSFTLVEVLTAIILISIIVVIFFASFITSFNYLRRVMELRTATLVLQEQASLVRELKFSDIQVLPADFTSSGMSSLHDAAGSIIKSAYQGHNNMIKLTLRLRWTAFDGKIANKTIVTLITDHGIDKK